MDLVINTFGARVRSSGERIVLALPDKTKKEYSIKTLEKIINLPAYSLGKFPSGANLKKPQSFAKITV